MPSHHHLHTCVRSMASPGQPPTKNLFGFLMIPRLTESPGQSGRSSGPEDHSPSVATTSVET